MMKALYARAGEKPVALDSEVEIARAFREGQGFLWVDLQGAGDPERGILDRVFKLHPLAIENCIAQTDHPRIDDFGDYLYLVIHGVKPRSEGVLTGGSRLQLQEVDIFLGANFLVTYHPGVQESIEAVRKKCQEVEASMRRGPDRVLAEILDHLVEEFFAVIESMDAEIDTLEDRLFRRASKPALREIFSLKKDVVRLRRVVNPQREVVNRLARMEHKAVSREETIFFRDVYDHLYRISEMLESFRDVLTGAMEVYLTVVSNRLNEIMKVMTIVSIILMSGALIAGLYGMNVPLPGAGSPSAFWWLLASMAAVAAGLLLAFKKRRWI